MTLTDMKNAMECKSTTRQYVAVQDAIRVYDYLGGLGNDTLARDTARLGLEKDLSLTDMQAAQLLAGALARRATLRRNGE